MWASMWTYKEVYLIQGRDPGVLALVVHWQGGDVKVDKVVWVVAAAQLKKVKAGTPVVILGSSKKGEQSQHITSENWKHASVKVECV